MLYKDVCGEDLEKMITLLWAYAYGLVNEKTLQHAIDNHGEGLDLNKVIEEAKKRISNFELEKP